ncbi:TonB-dependent receptor [Parabacteroides sp. Marseille-P3160]|uniref:SusC/RagA family TonB-linked outer membrane protein n=1 Tax=Parabacteroides sp. Marseille-P3160 TaxID=1917887 RepID=UPI0009BC3AFC|nr:TonB-dependent receptor [Parabacteroides sp. Marseille-P3160]
MKNFKLKNLYSQAERRPVLFVLLFFCFMSTLSVIAQNKTINGKVEDTKGEALPGVSVSIKGTSKGTITDLGGNYTIQDIPTPATLVFSFIGMETKEINVGNQSVINITLSEETKVLDEVVVIGYGTVRKKDLTGAVASVQGSALKEKATTRLSEALQGTMPGVMVTRTGSASDVSATIRIRGITTIGDSEPLIIIDGVPGSLDWVNPNDVESISVLKDAASASIYGSRAASGVILVTTKRAKSGQLSITYNYEYMIDKPTRIAEYVDAQTYMSLYNEMKWNDNGNNAGGEYPVYTKDVIDNYPSLHAENPNQYPDKDWLTSMLKKSAHRQSHKVSITGGTEKVKTNISLAYDQTEGLYKNKGYDRFTVRANNDININKYLSLEADISAIYSENKNPLYPIDPSAGCAPIYPMEWSDGRVASGKSGSNIYAQLNYGGFSDGKANVTRGKLALNLTPIKGLKISGVFSPEYYTAKGKAFYKRVPYTDWENPNMTVGYIGIRTTNYLSESRTENIKTTTQFLINYDKQIGNHSINTMLGYENYYFKSEALAAARDQYILTEFPYLDLGDKNYQTNGGNAYENAYRSYFGRVMYNYKNKYYLQANARYDGSSRFHRDHRWGLFPSFSTGWVLTEESFMKNIKPLSFLKLRFSWGTLGNEKIGNYPYQSTVQFGNSILYYGNNATAVQTAAIGNYTIENISWETTETYDIGIDANFFNNRLIFSGDYYKKKTKDMLLALAIPDYMGVSDPEQNTGKMHTKGWEFSVRWSDQIGDLGYSVSANLSDSKSIMGNLGGTQFLGSQVKYEGSEFNEWYGYVSEGIYQTQEEVDNSATLNARVKPGDIKYKDISGPDGIPDGIISAEYDRVLLGGSLPRYQYGGDIRLDYKGIDFSMVFQGIGKKNSLLSVSMIQPFRDQFMEVPELLTGNYWSLYNTVEQNENVKYPRLSEVGTTNNYSFSDFWLFNGAYFRLKNITLGYTIPKNIAEKCRLQNLRVYLSANDLFSIDNYPEGWDPETSSYWITKSFILGVSVKF